MARQEPKQVLEHALWVAGPYPVVDLCGAVKGSAWLSSRKSRHSAIVPVPALAGRLTAVPESPDPRTTGLVILKQASASSRRRADLVPLRRIGSHIERLPVRAKSAFRVPLRLVRKSAAAEP